MAIWATNLIYRTMALIHDSTMDLTTVSIPDMLTTTLHHLPRHMYLLTETITLLEPITLLGARCRRQNQRDGVLLKMPTTMCMVTHFGQQRHLTKVVAAALNTAITNPSMTEMAQVHHDISRVVNRLQPSLDRRLRIGRVHRRHQKPPRSTRASTTSRQAIL